VIVRIVYTAILASVVVSAVFSFGVVGLIRASELRREKRDGAAGLYTAGALVALAICLAATAYGIVLVGQK
jgi:hypothetical protein